MIAEHMPIMDRRLEWWCPEPGLYVLFVCDFELTYRAASIDLTVDARVICWLGWSPDDPGGPGGGEPVNDDISEAGRAA